MIWASRTRSGKAKAGNRARELAGVEGFEVPTWEALAHGLRPPTRHFEDHEPGGTRHGWQHRAILMLPHFSTFSFFSVALLCFHLVSLLFSLYYVWRQTKLATCDHSDDYCFLLGLIKAVSTSHDQRTSTLNDDTTTSVQSETVPRLHTHVDVPGWLQHVTLTFCHDSSHHLTRFHCQLQQLICTPRYSNL